jgi:quercetin dioxygenase-like cupin family protein
MFLRRKNMFITNLKKVKKIKPDMTGAEGVFKQVPLSREAGAPTFSFRVFTIEPGGHTPFHMHPFEHMQYVIEGNGALVEDDHEREIKKGDFALILPNEKHQVKNISATRDLLIICAVPKEYE